MSGQLHIPAALPPGKNQVPIEQASGWALEMFWTFLRGGEPLAQGKRLLTQLDAERGIILKLILKKPDGKT
jgi:hypothetical protein